MKCKHGNEACKTCDDLSAALKHTDSLSDEWFGPENQPTSQLNQASETMGSQSFGQQLKYEGDRASMDKEQVMKASEEYLTKHLTFGQTLIAALKECTDVEAHKNFADTLKMMHANAWTREQVFEFAYRRGSKDKEATGQKDEPVKTLTKEELEKHLTDGPGLIDDADWMVSLDLYKKLKQELAQAKQRIEVLENENVYIQKKRQELESVLDIAKDDYVKQVGAWKIIQRLEMQVKELEGEAGELRENNNGFAETNRLYDEENQKYRTALEKIAKPTYGTEFIAHDLEEYKSNYEIICRHYFAAQKLARKALGKDGGG